VAGETKKMAAVMHEFMNHVAIDESGCALFGSDEINGQDRQ
jgi:hypothetical protein